MSELKIVFDDDKKQKYQSVTASIDLMLPYPFNDTIDAYGATEEEATVNLLEEVQTLVTCLNEQHKKLLASVSVATTK